MSNHNFNRITFKKEKEKRSNLFIKLKIEFSKREVKVKKFFKGCLKNPMVIVFILILIFFMPIAIYSPGENRNRGVVIIWMKLEKKP